MFLVQWINFLSRKFSPRVSPENIREALAAYELPLDVIEQLTISVKTKVELEEVVTQASRVLWEKHMLKVCDDVNAWGADTKISGQLLIAAQWIVGRNCLHPCFAQRDWFAQLSVQKFDYVWEDISRYSVAEYLRVSPSKSGLDVTFDGKTKPLDLSNPLFRNELKFWLIFCNAVLVWGLTESGCIGARIRCESSLGAWSVLANHLEGLQSE